MPARIKASIWAPSGIAVGNDGSLYVATGNGTAQTDFDHGNALIRPDPALNELGFAAPTDGNLLNPHDKDLGSTGPLLLDGALVAVGGKDGRLHVSATDHLGGIGGELAATPICGPDGGVYGGMSAAGHRVYAPCEDGLQPSTSMRPARRRLSGQGRVCGADPGLRRDMGRRSPRW